MIGLKWIGPLMDASGYASASRNYAYALYRSGEVDLSLGVTSFEQHKTTHSVMEQLRPLVGRSVDHRIQVTHLTPENYPKFRDPICYNIAYTVWETDRLPSQWTDLCNQMDEIWVPGDWNVEVFKRSGVTRPVHKVVHAIPMPTLEDAKDVTMGKDGDTFVFYSIFQWIERKNPLGLLMAYLTEFNADDNVALVLKTYRINPSRTEQEIIKKEIRGLKETLRLGN